METSKKNNRIDAIIKKGNSMEIGSVIDKSFETYKKTFLIGALATLLFIALVLLFYGFLIGILFGFGEFSEMLVNANITGNDPMFFIGINAAVTVVSALIAPYTAGLIHINYLADHNKEFSFSNVFDFFNGLAFKEIFIAFLIIGFTNSVVSALSLIDMNNILLTIFVYILQITISILTIYTIPLIIYSKLNAYDALSKSIALAKQKPFEILALFIIAGVGILIGFVGLCIGIFFTIPYIYSMYYAIYQQTVGFDDKSPIEEIGQE